MEKTVFIGGGAGGGRRAGFLSRLKRGAVTVAAKVVARATEKVIRRLDPEALPRPEPRVARRARVIERRATGRRGPARKRRRPSKLARRMMTSLGVRNTAAV